MIRAPRVTPRRLLIGASVGMGAVLILANEISATPVLAAVVAIVVSLGALAALVRIVPGRTVTLGSAYLFVFALFHIGLLPFVLTGTVPPLLMNTDASWYYSPLLGVAIVSVTLGTLVFLVGYAASSVRRPRRRTQHLAALVVDGASGPGEGVGLIGLTLLAGGVVLWFVSTPGHGVNFVAESYVSFLAGTSGSVMSLAYLLIGLGMAGLPLSPSIAIRRWGMAMFVVFALPAFVVGLRGEVIIPFAAWAVATARRRPMRVRPWNVVALVVTLTLGSVVRQVRQSGLSAAHLGDITVNPFDGLAELGLSVRPVALVHLWHGSAGEAFVGWGTYWAPVQRLVLGRILGLPTVPTTVDGRVFSTTVLQRVGAIGGSPVAESYRAAGVTGIMVVMVLIGLLVGWLDRRPVGSVADAGAGLVGYVLLVWVRNDFTPVPLELLACVAVVGSGRVLQRALATSRARAPGTVGV